MKKQKKTTKSLVKYNLKRLRSINLIKVISETTLDSINSIRFNYIFLEGCSFRNNRLKTI